MAVKSGQNPNAINDIKFHLNTNMGESSLDLLVVMMDWIKSVCFVFQGEPGLMGGLGPAGLRGLMVDAFLK